MCPEFSGSRKKKHAKYAATALPSVPISTIHSTIHSVSLLWNSTLILISMPTPMRKYGMNSALPINSILFISADTRGIYRLRISPDRNAPRIPSKPAASDIAADMKSIESMKINCMIASE